MARAVRRGAVERSAATGAVSHAGLACGNFLQSRWHKVHLDRDEDATGDMHPRIESRAWYVRRMGGRRLRAQRPFRGGGAGARRALGARTRTGGSGPDRRWHGDRGADATRLRARRLLGHPSSRRCIPSFDRSSWSGTVWKWVHRRFPLTRSSRPRARRRFSNDAARSALRGVLRRAIQEGASASSRPRTGGAVTLALDFGTGFSTDHHDLVIRLPESREGRGELDILEIACQRHGDCS
jgi:hypothetical protein